MDRLSLISGVRGHLPSLPWAACFSPFTLAWSGDRFEWPPVSLLFDFQQKLLKAYDTMLTPMYIGREPFLGITTSITGFNPQHLQGSSQPSVTLGLGVWWGFIFWYFPMAPWPQQAPGLLMVHRLTCRQNTYTHKVFKKPLVCKLFILNAIIFWTHTPVPRMLRWEDHEFKVHPRLPTWNPVSKWFLEKIWMESPHLPWPAAQQVSWLPRFEIWLGYLSNKLHCSPKTSLTT